MKLVAIPFYLNALMSSVAGEAFPQTKEAVLSIFVAKHEAVPDKAEVLRRDVLGFHGNMLRGLSVEANRIGNPTLAEEIANRTITAVGRVLVQADQLASPLQPVTVLDALVDAHIVACGLTHVVHVWSALSGAENIGVHAFIGIITALASVATAIAFVLIVPQIRMLPSPARHRAVLEEMVQHRTREKDALLCEINHQIGNQLQVMSSIVSMADRQASLKEPHEVLEILRNELVKMAEHIIASLASITNA